MGLTNQLDMVCLKGVINVNSNGETDDKQSNF